jgi:hypothetical protein
MNLETFVTTRSAMAVLLTLFVPLAARGQTPLPITSVTASANNGNQPALVLDGNLATRWSAQGAGQWIAFDLGATHPVAAADIAWFKGDERVAKFEIQTSGTGTDWTSVFQGNGSGTNANFERFPMANTPARFVRIVGYGNNLNDWNSLAEVRLFEAEIPVETRLPVVVVSASSHDGNRPANTLDGSYTTRWSAKGAGQWILYDVGVGQTVTALHLAWYRGDRRTDKFDVRTSVDGIKWTVAYKGVSSGDTLAPETYPLTATPARYVSVVGWGNTENAWTSITETEIYGYAADATNPPAGGEGLPASRLDLANWKLTLPLNTSHPGKPDEITQPELATFQDAEYFHLNAAGNAVVFKAACGGTSTSGSGYPRSELREMANQGLDNASWSTTSGTHTMIITQAITHLPVVKPHLVAGQIHNANDDIIVFRLEGQTLFIDENGESGPVLTDHYALGEVFTAGFIARAGAVECYYNGKFIYAYPVKSAGCYFKAGCYTQSNTRKGDTATAYGEVTIYGLSVSHQP